MAAACEAVDISVATAQADCESAEFDVFGGQVVSADCTYFSGVTTNVTIIPYNPLEHKYRHLPLTLIDAMHSHLKVVCVNGLEFALPFWLSAARRLVPEVLACTGWNRYVTEVGGICEKISFAANTSHPGQVCLPAAAAVADV